MSEPSDPNAARAGCEEGPRGEEGATRGEEGATRADDEADRDTVMMDAGSDAIVACAASETTLADKFFEYAKATRHATRARDSCVLHTPIVSELVSCY